MNSSVIIFPGSNCDRDMSVALKKFGFKNNMVWHNDINLPKSDLVVFIKNIKITRAITICRCTIITNEYINIFNRFTSLSIH